MKERLAQKKKCPLLIKIISIIFIILPIAVIVFSVVSLALPNIAFYGFNSVVLRDLSVTPSDYSPPPAFLKPLIIILEFAFWVFMIFVFSDLMRCKKWARIPAVILFLILIWLIFYLF